MFMTALLVGIAVACGILVAVVAVVVVVASAALVMAVYFCSRFNTCCHGCYCRSIRFFRWRLLAFGFFVETVMFVIVAVVAIVILSAVVRVEIYRCL